jgi:hypothetical protein
MFSSTAVNVSTGTFVMYSSNGIKLLSGAYSASPLSGTVLQYDSFTVDGSTVLLMEKWVKSSDITGVSPLAHFGITVNR